MAMSIRVSFPNHPTLRLQAAWPGRTGLPLRAAGNPKWEEDEDVLIDEDQDQGLNFPAQLIVYNDDFNTFEWVIQCFVDVLNHSLEQAEQLALIIHFKGKATVKSGAKSELLPLREALIDRGLSAVVEEIG